MKLGALLTAVTVIVNVCAALVSSPPKAVPPSSTRLDRHGRDAARARRRRCRSGSRRLHLRLRGNSEGLSLLTMNETVWPASFGGPGEMPVAHPVTVRAPASSSTVWSAPAMKLGRSLTAVTVIVKLWRAGVAAAAGRAAVVERATVTVAVPLASGAGVLGQRASGGLRLRAEQPRVVFSTPK